MKDVILTCLLACLSIVSIIGVLEILIVKFLKEGAKFPTILCVVLSIFLDITLWITGLRPKGLWIFVINIILVLAICMLVILIAYVIYEWIYLLHILKQACLDAQASGCRYLNCLTEYDELLLRYNQFVDEVNYYGRKLIDGFKKRKEIQMDASILVTCPIINTNLISFFNLEIKGVINGIVKEISSYVNHTNNLYRKIIKQNEYLEIVLENEHYMEEFKKIIEKSNRSDFPDSTRKKFLEIAEESFMPLEKKGKIENRIKRVKSHFWDKFI